MQVRALSSDCNIIISHYSMPCKSCCRQMTGLDPQVICDTLHNKVTPLCSRCDEERGVFSTHGATFPLDRYNDQ